MKALPHTPELLGVAERVVWFKSPGDALDDPVHFLAHVMTYGTMEDLQALKPSISGDELRGVLENAPPGIFDARSWAYWHLVLRGAPAPPLPTRKGLED